MRLNLGMSRTERKALRKANTAELRRIWRTEASRWHLHFAILPIYIKKGDWRWLEFVERKLNTEKRDFWGDLYPVWDYRPARKKKPKK